MDDGESSAPTIRKRTESNGGSDSELSEGWNIIDQVDVTNHDVPSSDGESIEVIEAEEESRESVTDTEMDGETRLAHVSEAAVELSTESEFPVVRPGTPREEVFDSSFRWFLIYATAAVLVSNLAFMVAENVFAWNADVNTETPSFLRDFPTTPKLVDGSNIIKNIPLAEKEEAVVEYEDHVSRNYRRKIERRPQIYETKRNPQYKSSDLRFEKHKNEKSYKQQNERSYKQQNENFYKYQNENNIKQHENDETQQKTYKFDDNQIGRFLNTLSEETGFSETKDKLKQVFFILDGLHIGLNDLEDVAENSELKYVLKNQKRKLFQIVTEMEYGVTKSIDRVATNILNKVRKLERSFERQWCDLEKRGNQEQLKGLFYDCQDEEKSQNDFQTSKTSKEMTTVMDDLVKESSNMDMKWDNFQYQVDKDSPGKEHSNSHGIKIKEIEDYYVLVKTEMENNVESSNIKSTLDSSSTNENDSIEYTTDNKAIDDKINLTDNNGKYNSGKENLKEKHVDKQKDFEPKGKRYEDNPEKNKRNLDNDRGKQTNRNGKHHNAKFGHNNDKGKRHDKRWQYNGQKKYSDDRPKDYDKRNTGKPDDRGTFSDDKRKQTKKFETYKQTEQGHNKEQNKNREPHAKSEKSVPNSGPELIRKYLKESCEKGRKKFNNMYEKLKSYVDSKLRVPKEMFDTLFAKYCHVNDDSFKWEKRYNREHPKGDFMENNKKNFFKKELMGNDLNNNYLSGDDVRIIDITELRPENKEADSARDNIIVSDNQPRHWIFKEDEAFYDNKSNLTGYWFFKAGESRNKMRWSHTRSDWLFDRAYHRRTQPRPNWFLGRRKNWYFRRAWARQNCHHNNWCDFSDEETVTIPNPSKNL